jgi:hypothetical protein
MAVRILESRNGESCFYCSTTMWAFGPVFDDVIIAEQFLKWLSIDPRQYSDKDLEFVYAKFRAKLEVVNAP